MATDEVEEGMQLRRKRKGWLAPNGSLNQLSRQLGTAAAKAARARLTASPNNLARYGYSYYTRLFFISNCFISN